MKVSAITTRTSPIKTKNYSPNFKEVYYYKLDRFMQDIYVARDNDKKLIDLDYLVAKFKVNMKETTDKSPDIAIHVGPSNYTGLTFLFEPQEDYKKRGWFSKIPDSRKIPIGFTIDKANLMHSLSYDYFVNGLPKEVDQACKKVREVEKARKKCEREHPNLDKRAINQMLVEDYHSYCSETSKRVTKAIEDFDHECFLQLRHE